MRAGHLKHRITIEQPAGTTSASGATVAPWPGIEFAKRWAEIVPSGGREFFAAAAMHAELSLMLKIRGRLAVDPTMRVVFDGVAYDILAAWGEDGKHPSRADCVYLACKQGQSQGS